MLVQMYMCNFAILLVVSMKNKYEEDLEMEEGTICQGITEAIREVGQLSNRRQLVCRVGYQGKAQLQSERNHTGEQTCDQVVTLAPEPMPVYEM